MTERTLVVGLGNPGDRYAGTRHNIGAMVVAELAARAGVTLSAHRARAVVAETRMRPGAPRLVLAQPLSWMNVSGGPVRALSTYYSLGLEDLVVVHDDIDFPFGAVKLKRGGGEGGHNGLRDISKAMKGKDYVRVRVGVGRPPGRMDAADYVLKRFSGAEAKELPLLVSDAADAVEMLAEQGLTATQQHVHARNPA
ncbi:aminoacyl-tRNA hydrolase [Kocuria tytonicola]|uniref:Peptidyl-tRNA hydrolase n=1 Tax=Kocuria tytonicola TaxID=2055946 RepID=A0A3L9L1K6_9MICC|nr:aminoacyl-tRNA hydrolase [Kocuria tytonicola]RLY92441.1 aminoacyl-tRNA hydrolase [Kocuria tytonicola]